MRIEYIDIYFFEKVSALLIYFKRPFVLLGFGRQVVLRETPGSTQHTYLIELRFNSDLLNSKGTAFD